MVTWVSDLRCWDCFQGAPRKQSLRLRSCRASVRRTGGHGAKSPRADLSLSVYERFLRAPRIRRERRLPVELETELAPPALGAP